MCGQGGGYNATKTKELYKTTSFTSREEKKEQGIKAKSLQLKYLKMCYVLKWKDLKTNKMLTPI